MTVSGPLFSHLVLDAGPLFQQGSSLSSRISENFYTVPEVLAEVKDTASREGLARLPFELKVKSPSAEALKVVQDFAKATGDVAVLSATDIKIIALAATLELEHNGVDTRMQREPRLMKIHEAMPPQSVATKKAPSQPKKKRGGVEVTSFDEEPVEEKAEEPVSEENEDSDEGEWITPDNVHKLRVSTPKAWSDAAKPTGPSVVEGEKKTAQAAVRVACVSGDFALQNVLLQMRLKLYSPDGQRIRRLKNWLLRCHACYATTKQLDKRFCPKCGGPTLLRTSYSVDGTGKVTLHLRADYHYRLRGTQYSMPMPKGGRAPDNLILREDQIEYERAQRSFERSQRKAAKGVTIDVIDDRLSSIFGGMSISGSSTRDGTAKAYFDGVAPPVIGAGKRNPNEVRRTRK